MSYSFDQSNQYSSQHIPVALLETSRRTRFIMRTYAHLLAAMIGFTLIEVFLFRSGLAQQILRIMVELPWLLIIGGFMIVGWMATRVAHQAASPVVQYLALAGFVVAEAVMFLPLLLVAELNVPGVTQSAGLVTLVGFIGLTGVVFVTRKDFSFMTSVLMWAGVVALLLIVASLIFGFELGTWFSVAMIAVAGGSILRDTSRIMRYYPEDRYVAAALELFASVALLFWYVLRLMSRRR